MKQILLIEDNEDNAFLFRALVAMGDYQLIEATTGLKAIENGMVIAFRCVTF